ncbi:MAG: dTDP-4-dehydrorhamnose reductase [Lachnospiraceae bacterium]|nr:dTDP-4-dehydrorhamnose reductase [Lachnospiraceae bacterium]
MRILVTGVSGQLGNEVIKVLSAQGHTVIGTARNISALPVLTGVSYVTLDLADPSGIASVLAEAKPEAILHCASYVAVDMAEAEKELCFLTNETATEVIARYCGEQNIPLLYTSTEYVFDGSGDRPWTTGDTPAPLNVYGASKYAGELAVARFAPKHFIVRICWTYAKNSTNFVNTMLSLAQTHDTLRVITDQIGTPTYIPDLAPLLAEMITTDRYGLYHAANEGYCSRYEMTCELIKLAGLPVTVLPVDSSAFPAKAVRPKNCRLDTSSLTEAGFSALPHWQNALKRYILE